MPLLPLFVPLAENDVSLRGGVEESVVSSVASLDTTALLTGGRGSFRALSRAEDAFYGLDLSGYYGRLTTLSLKGSGQPPRDNYSATAGVHTAWVLTPFSQLYFDGTGFIANRLAIRSNDPLAARDPFLKERVEYALDPGLALGGQVSKRTSYRVGAAYIGAGGISSPEPDAVGPDVHGVKATWSLAYELGARTYAGPEIGYAYTHFFHALLDSQFHRGVADIHAGTLRLGVTRVFSRRLMVGAAGGATVATPPPILDSTTPVVEPDVRLNATYLSRASRATLTYSYAYTSLGPRIGYGNQHLGTIEYAVNPIRGGRFRDFDVRWLGSVSYGKAPTEIVLLNMPTAGVLPTRSGDLTTFATVVGARLDLPVLRGVFLTVGYDLQLIKASFDPAPPEGQPSAQLVSIATAGIMGVLSTDRRDLVAADLIQPDVDERAGTTPYGEQDVDARMRDPYATPPPTMPYGADQPPPAPIDEHTYVKPEPPRSDSTPTDGPQPDPTIVDPR